MINLLNIKSFCVQSTYAIEYSNTNEATIDYYKRMKFIFCYLTQFLLGNYYLVTFSFKLLLSIISQRETNKKILAEKRKNEIYGKTKHNLL